MNKSKYYSIILFYAIAIFFSYLFRIHIPGFIVEFNPGNELFLLRYLLEGIGPFAGAFIAMKLFRIKNDITVPGSSKTRALLMCAAPLILFSVIGIKNEMNFNSHYYGFLIAFISLTYSFLEEYGWRKFLNTELKEVSVIPRSIIVGTLWFCWHLNFSSGIKESIIFWCVLVVASWGIGKIADDTKSIAAAACFHMLGSIVSFNKLITFSSSERYLILFILLIVWIYTVSTWNKHVKSKAI